MNGAAISIGLHDTSPPHVGKTPIVRDRWVSGQLVIIDFDKINEPLTAPLTLIPQSLRPHIAAAFPSSSYSPESPKYHFIMILDTSINDYD
ncbi:MAG: hypothetical protein CUN56_17275, partial [Phototrophicales bacterium]